MPCHMYILFCQLPVNSVPTLLSANMGTNSLVSPRCALLVYILTANKNKLITNSFVLYYSNIFRQCTASTNVMFVVTQCSLEKLNHLWFGDEYGRVISYCLMNWMLLSSLLANFVLYLWTKNNQDDPKYSIHSSLVYFHSQTSADTLPKLHS